MINRPFPFRQLPVVIILAIVTLTGCTVIQPIKTKRMTDAPDRPFSHADFDRVLGRFVDERGLVDYRTLSDNADVLESYYRLIAAYSPDSHPELFPGQDHQLAYWINAYNAAAIKTVLTRYPIGSVLDFKAPVLFFFLSDKAGFFFFQRLSFGGQSTSLFYLENKVIRKRFHEPRVHFALNCASMGCPRLPQTAFSGEMLEWQLEMATRRFLSEARNFNIDHDTRTIHLSSIFKWFRKDFTDWYKQHYPDKKASLLSYILRYLPPEKGNALKKAAGRYTIEYIPYDWRLNDQMASRG